MIIKVAVVQMAISIFDAEAALIKAKSYIKKASGRADIIVFPEYLISWNFTGDENYYRKEFQNLAKEYGIDIVTGSMLTKSKNKLFNTTYYISSKGKIKGTYKKINLWHLEKPETSPGNEICVFNTKFGRIGLCICWDLAFPEIYREMVKKKALIVICPSFWNNQDASPKGLKYNPLAEQLFIDSCCVSRAFENEIIHIFCNAAGEEKNQGYKKILAGHSQITVPFKGAIKKLNHNKEEMFIQEIDTSILKDAEKAYKIRADLKKIEL